jgi:hypothetical protein
LPHRNQNILRGRSFQSSGLDQREKDERAFLGLCTIFKEICSP